MSDVLKVEIGNRGEVLLYRKVGGIIVETVLALTPVEAAKLAGALAIGSLKSPVASGDRAGAVASLEALEGTQVGAAIAEAEQWAGRYSTGTHIAPRIEVVTDGD